MNVLSYSYLFSDKRTCIFIICYYLIFTKFSRYIPNHDIYYGIFPTDILTIVDI